MSNQVNSPSEPAPTSNLIVTTSFFDDDNTITGFTFSPVLSIHLKDLSVPFTVKGRLSVNHNESKSYILSLHNNILARYQSDDDKMPAAILNVSHSRLRYIKPTTETSEPGFSLTKNGSLIEFYHHDKLVVDSWFEALKKWTVLSTFHDDYKAIKMIGRGSFAKVYLVESKNTGKQFAVKAFTKDAMNVSNKANAKPSMLNEIDIMRAIDHDNLIRLHEVYETDKSIYLVLELIQGKSLYDYLKKSNFKAEEGYATKINNIARSLLDALAYLASKGIMHRDLKPDNILLDQGNKVKIVDFGLATFIDLDVYIFKKCGTPGYIAPEVFKYDEKDKNTNYHDTCDVFSVGCLLYYMLYTTPLFDAPTAADILRKNRSFAATSPIYESLKKELADPNSKQPKDAIKLIIDLIEFEHNKRITASQALAYPYFMPIPTGMTRVAGTNEFTVPGLSTPSSTHEYSPCSPLKIPNMSYEQAFSPLLPLKIDLQEVSSPALVPRDRFIKDDGSVYLDMGKPDITGRIDTIANGSSNNSLLFVNRADSISSCASPCLKSTFGQKSASKSGAKQYKAGGGQSFLKAAIFRNMQKNSEGARDEEVSEICSPKILPSGDLNSPGNRSPYLKSPGLRFNMCAEVKEQAGQEGDEEEILNRIQFNFGSKVETLETGTGHGKTLGESALGKARKFQPLANTLIIPKHSGRFE